jgi:hypothetical protein
MIEQRKASRMSRPRDENSGTMDKLSTPHARTARKCANLIASGAAKPPSLPTASVRCGQMPKTRPSYAWSTAVDHCSIRDFGCLSGIPEEAHEIVPPS